MARGHQKEVAQQKNAAKKAAAEKKGTQKGAAEKKLTFTCPICKVRACDRSSCTAPASIRLPASLPKPVGLHTIRKRLHTFAGTVADHRVFGVVLAGQHAGVCCYEGSLRFEASEGDLPRRGCFRQMMTGGVA